MARNALAGAGGMPLSADILRLLLESSQDALYAVGLDPLRLLYATPAFARRLGLPDDFLAQGYDFDAFLSSVHPDDRERVAQIIRGIQISRADADLPENPTTYRLRMPAGSFRVIQDSYRVLRGPDGAAQTLLGNSRDVCEQNAARQTLAENQALFLLLAENSHDIFFTMRFPEGRYEFLSPRVETLFGLTPQDFYDDPGTLMRCIAPDWREAVQGWIAEIAQGNVAASYEFQVLDKAGRLRWLNQRQVLVPAPDGQGMLLQGVASDHTEEHESREALRQSEEHFRQLIEAWPEQVMLSVNLTKGRHEYVSPSMERVMGYAPQEFYDDPGLGMRVVAPQWREQAWEWIAQINQGVLQPAYEFELVHKSGEHRFIHQVGALRPRTPGQDLIVQFTFRDITDERHAREALRQSEARYRELAEGWTDQVVMRINLDTGRPEYVSPSMERLFGHTPESVLNSPPESIVAPGWGEQIGQWLEENRQGIIRPEYQHEILDIWGDRRWVSARGTLLRDGQGRPRTLQLALFDITARKRLEEELRTSRAFLDCIIEQSPVSMWISDASGTLIRSNQALRTLFQVSEEEVAGRYNIFEDNQALELGLMPQIRRVYDEGGTTRFMLPYDTRHIEGLNLARSSSAYLDVTISAVQDERGKTTNLIVQHLDISEHKRAEEELRTSRAFLDCVIEQSPMSMWISDASGTLIRTNQALRDRLRITDADVVGRFNIFADNQALEQGFMPQIRRVYEQGGTERFTLAYDTGLVHGLDLSRPTRVILDLTISAVQDEQGRTSNLIIQHLDISEHKRLEAELSASERKYRSLHENMRDGFAAVDQNGFIIEHNSAFRDMLGYAEDEIAALTYEDITPERWHEAEARIVEEQVFVRGYSDVFEKEYIRKDGTVFPVSLRIYRDEDCAQRSVRLWAIVRDITESRRAVQALRISEERFRELVEGTQSLITQVDAAGLFTYVNPMVRAVLGLEPEDCLGRPAFEIVHPDDRETTRASFHGWVERRLPHTTYENRLISVTGEVRHFSWSIHFQYDADGSVTLVDSIARDITERKRSEQALRKNEALLGSMLRNLPFDFWARDMNEQIILQSEESVRLWGDLTRRPLTVERFGEQTLAHWRSNNSRALAGQIVSEECAYTLDGDERREYHNIVAPIRDGEDILGLIGVNIDITERKRNEEALRESEERFRLIVETASEGIWTIDAEQRATFVNAAMAQMLGYTVQEMLQAPSEIFIFPEDRSLHSRRMEQRRAGHDEVYERRFRRKDGTALWTLASAKPLMDKDGNYVGAFGMFMDITERKRMEEALRESEERYRQLAESWTEHVILRINLRTMLHEYVSPSVERLFGYTPEQYLRADPAVLGAVAPEWRDQVARWAQEAAAGVLRPEYEYEVYDAWGQRRWVYQRGALLCDAAGAPIAVQFMLSDVTERKRMEAALTLIQERYDLALRGANDGIWDWDLLQGEVYYSDRWKEIIGYAPDELRHNVEEWTSRIHPEDFDRVMAENMRCVSGQTPIFQVEYRLRHKDGHYCWIFGRGAALANAAGRVVRVAGAHTDITARKQAEEALFKSERLSRKLLESMHEGVWAVDADRRTIFINDRLCAMLGYASAELMDMTPTDVLEGPQPPSGKPFSDLESGSSSATDFVLMRKDGTRFPAHVVSSPIVEEQGSFEGLVCGVVDLTERARMEHELRRNQARFEALYELSRLSPATERQLAAFTLREAIRLTDSAAGVLFFVSEDDTTLEPKAWETGSFMTTGYIPCFPTSGQLPWALVVQNGLPLMINDYSPSAHLVPPGHPAVTRFLGVPALDGARPAAVLGLTGKAEPYTAEDTLQTTLLLDGMWREVRTRRDEERIRASLREKDALLHEVHHRVKNNLQVISSLMDMAGRRLDNPEARLSLAELRGKVQAMSLIHAQLHGFGSEGGISLERFVRALFNQLREVYSGGLTLSLVVELSSLALGLDQAVPLGLALNEALTNVFKHASTESKPGRVFIRAGQDEAGKVYILVRDDGPGLPPGLVPARAQSLGMKLMHGLVRHQLGGQLEVHSTLPPVHSGVEVCICFRPNNAR